MAYTENEKSTGLDVLTGLDAGDLHIVGDVSDSGRAKAITQNNLEIDIANSNNFVDELVTNAYFTSELANDVNFVDELVANNYFTTELANESNFLTELTTNSTFQTAVNNFVTVSGGGGGGGSGGKPMTFALSNVSGGGGATVNGYQDREALIGKDSNTIIVFQDVANNTQSRQTTSDLAGATSIKGYALIGAYLYVLVVKSTATTAATVYRYDVADLSLGGTAMTESGASIVYSTDVIMTSDGSSLFFSADGGNSANTYEIAKYTISGTTLTYVSTVTCGATATRFSDTMMVDAAGNYYGSDGVGTGIIYQYDSSGTIASTSGDTGAGFEAFINWGDTLYASDAGQAVFVKQYIADTQDAPSGIQTKEVSLSSVDILALDVTPIELIPAPGADKIIIIENVVQNFTAGTQYSGGSHEIVYSGDSTPITEALPSYNSATSYISRDSGADSNDITVGINTAVDIQSAGGTYTTGTGTVTLIIQYSIINL